MDCRRQLSIEETDTEGGRMNLDYTELTKKERKELRHLLKMISERIVKERKIQESFHLHIEMANDQAIEIPEAE